MDRFAALESILEDSSLTVYVIFSTVYWAYKLFEQLCFKLLHPSILYLVDLPKMV